MAGNENPVQAFLHCCTSVARSLHSHLSLFFPSPNEPSSKRSLSQDTKLVLPAVSSLESIQKPVAAPLTKEELGRATWTLLHTIAAQYPDNPTRQQKHDVKELMAILSRIYPCKECADHFKEVLKANPVQAGSQAELSQWLCHVHNVVNRSLGKLVFPCQRVNARWGKLDCKDRACDLEGTSSFGS
ncbi:FAD-linked sulfhydryl oxidase ERV1 [Dioscorea cayenensis subsp. rotundata]|uniref:Sulfhydryl oxidase n=1 Tax=Dioscorea cayennensis subsp. rotundata TaxID=55577 RepID=A0AB40CG89_DIOCR|nr:FAD-linked sulfhydryl oxidase ERV1 [Dioscorea cayenensis subsp. rotundata]